MIYSEIEIQNNLKIHLESLPRQSGEFEIIADYFIQKRPALTVEIGTFSGYMTFWMAVLSMHYNFKTEIHAYDIYEHKENPGISQPGLDQVNSTGLKTYEEVFDQVMEKFPFLKQIIIKHKGDSKILGKYLNRKIDFLIIDGDHSYEGVKGDIKTFCPKLNKSGIVVFHDYWKNQERKLGVKRAVNEMIFSNNEYQLLSQGELVVIFQKVL